ncbi:hypothetical protein, partial [Mesorhizobium loti]|uniref:hypothetical protein n=1 Tax=Rhizobium loti TaxID=381 RepID=UPI001AECEDD0
PWINVSIANIPSDTAPPTWHLAIPHQTTGEIDLFDRNIYEMDAWRRLRPFALQLPVSIAAGDLATEPTDLKSRFVKPDEPWSSRQRAEGQMNKQVKQPPAIDTSGITRAGYIGPEGTWTHQITLDRVTQRSSR